MATIESKKGMPWYNDVKQGMAMNGGRPIIKVDPATGRPAVYGASGHPI